MNTQDETQLDCFVSLGDAFLLVVAATCGRTLERVLATAREEEDRRQLVMRKGGGAHDREC